MLVKKFIGVLYKLIKLNVAVLIKIKCYSDGTVKSVTQFLIILGVAQWLFQTVLDRMFEF